MQTNLDLKLGCHIALNGINLHQCLLTENTIKNLVKHNWCKYSAGSWHLNGVEFVLSIVAQGILTLLFFVHYPMDSSTTGHGTCWDLLEISNEQRYQKQSSQIAFGINKSYLHFEFFKSLLSLHVLPCFLYELLLCLSVNIPQWKFLPLFIGFKKYYFERVFFCWYLSKMKLLQK